MVYLLTILSTSRAPSPLLSFIWVHRISSLTSRGSTLLEALFTLTWLHTCPSVSPSNAGCLWIPADGFTHSERFQFDQSTEETFFLIEKKKRQKLSEPSTERHKAPLSVFSSLHPDYLLRGERLYNKQYSDFTRNVQLWLCRAGLVFLIAIHLNSSLWAYLLTWEDVNVQQSFTQHSIAIAYFDCIFNVCVRVAII